MLDKIPNKNRLNLGWQIYMTISHARVLDSPMIHAWHMKIKHERDLEWTRQERDGAYL